MGISSIFYLLGIISGSVLAVGAAVNLISSIQLWPLERKSEAWLVYSLLGIFYVSFTVTLMRSVSPVSEFTLSNWSGLILTVFGLSFFLWSISSLHLRETFGFEGEFCSQGPYGICRNPQTLGLIILSIGAILLTGSQAVSVLTIFHLAFLLLIIPAEESWLRKKYGEKYKRYREKVPNRLIPRLKIS